MSRSQKQNKHRTNKRKQQRKERGMADAFDSSDMVKDGSHDSDGSGNYGDC